jgi:DNA-binding MarR family transcriptional regulator
LDDRRQVNVTLTEKGVALDPQINARATRSTGSCWMGSANRKRWPSNMRWKKFCSMRDSSLAGTRHATITAPLVEK